MTNLLTPQQLHDYQKECVLHMLYNDDSMLWLGTGLGKEQPLSEPVLTPSGWVAMGDLVVGDLVVGADGKPTEVVAIHPQGVKEVLKVTFSDGTWTRCGWDHLWNVKTGKDLHLGNDWRTLSLRDLVDTGLSSKSQKSTWLIPLCAPVEYSAVELPVDPYLLGVYLGDGTCGKNSMSLCTDVEIIRSINVRYLRPHKTSEYTAYAAIPVDVRQCIESLGLNGKRSWEKFIPELYLRASVDQRLSILQGLLDTDGSPITCGGGIEYSTTSPMLRDAVIELVQSLGGVAREGKCRYPEHQNGTGRLSYRVNVKLPPEFTPFRLTRKLQNWTRPTKYLPQRRIRSVEHDGYEESQCIRVAATDHLYLTRNYIVTHNTPTTLTVIVDRMRAGQVSKVLIFGPLRVVNAVWARESRKWDHTKHLRFSLVTGSIEKRKRALFANADIYLCNYENMNWLAEQLMHYYVSQGKPLPFEMVVYDEVSKLKSSTSQRMSGGTRDKEDKWGYTHKIKVTGWRKLINQFKYRVGLTGTPACNGYMDLHGQYLAVDGGKRLGEYVTGYRDSYFVSDYMGWSYTPSERGKEIIETRIADITKKMDAKDYLDMPDCTVVNIMVDIPPKARKAYEEVEQQMFTQLDSGCEIEVFSRASVYNKCLQFCIAEGTEVLTKSGWKPIEQFNNSDQVWDGVEWVSVYSLAFQGYKEVIELDGVWMTPDHKVLTLSGWKEAEEIVHGYADSRFDRVHVRLPDCVTQGRVNGWGEKTCNLESEVCLREGICDDRSEPSKPSSTRCQIVRLSKRGSDNRCNRFSRYVKNKTVHHMVEHEVTLQKPKRQRLPELRCKRHRRVRRVVQFFHQILGRHGCELQRSLHDRKERQQQGIQCRKLPMVNTESTIKQQEGKPLHNHTPRCDDGDASCSQVRIQGCDFICKDTERMEGRRPVITSKIEKTYDLINAGKRNRFTVRGADGKIFIVHNCNGSPYLSPETSDYEALHDAKLEALDDILEEAGGSPVLCSYSFKSDAERIMKRFKKYKPVNLTATKASDTEKVVNDFAEGKIKLMIGHAASIGHGIDGLQQSCSIVVWFGLNWSLELYEQMNGRIDRQGQKSPVRIIRILCNDSVDLAVADALARKTDDQNGLKDAIQRYRTGITTNELEVNFI